jgi:hypothetical protein
LDWIFLQHCLLGQLFSGTGRCAVSAAAISVSSYKQELETRDLTVFLCQKFLIRAGQSAFEY